MPNKNKRVLITGASKGIGSSIAYILSQNGFEVFITGRDTENLQKLCEKTGIKGYFSIDLLEKAACEKLAEKAGDIDILINNAGDYFYSKIENSIEKDILKLIKLNVEVPITLTKLLVPGMKQKKWGRIINIGSISAVVGEANASIYSATKSSMIGFTKALALELAEDNITVNMINPGWVETALAFNAVEKSDFSLDECLDTIPQKRFIHPSEIASLCKYLASEDAKGITGQMVNICAGLSLG